MQITKTTLRRIIKEELDAVMKEGPLDMLRNLGRKKKTAAPAEAKPTCAKVRQTYNKIAPETTYGTIGDNAMAMQRQLIEDNPGCFTAEEERLQKSDPSKLVTGAGPMNEVDRDPRLQAVGLVQAIKAELDTANAAGTSADPERMMRLLNQLERAIEGI